MPPTPPFSDYVHERNITVITDVEAALVVSNVFRGRQSLFLRLHPGDLHCIADIGAPLGTDAWTFHTALVQAVRDGSYGAG
jgi:hypothetical protein